MCKALFAASLLFGALELAAATLGSSCTAPLGPGTAAPGAPFWLQSIQHQGTSAFNTDTTYTVFRNVKDYGAVGDGVTDDTAAINLAMSTGNRCGEETCGSSTLTPAIVYFPSGVYLVSTPIIAWYFTQLIGDARDPPTLLASADFNGIGVIDADPYTADGQWYVNDDNFYRSVRNFIIDIGRVPATTGQFAIHWRVSQATSLINLVINMSTAPGNQHTGVFVEDGSGGFMGDLVLNGGNFAFDVGNQQFTVRNMTVNNANVAINAFWNWGWTWQGVNINNCQVGFALATTQTTDQDVGSEVILDAVVTNTPVFIQTSSPAGPLSDSAQGLGGSIYLNNIKLNNVTTAVEVLNGPIIFAGTSGSATIDSWAQGNVFSGTDGTATFVQSEIAAPSKPGVLLRNDGSGKVFGRGHPQYEAYDVSQFVSVKSLGAVGDGETDDTAKIQGILNDFAGCKIIFFDAGTYVITSTVTIPPNTRIVGEVWTTLLGTGDAFSDINNPQPVFKVGESGDHGTVEITDIVFSTRGPAPGAIVVEWNIHDPSGEQGVTGMWDTHFRLAGAVGTDLEASCGLNPSTTGPCFAAFLALHLTPHSSAYLEGTWVWLADHDLDGDQSQFGAYSGRGILSESQGPVWMIGTAEHHTLYQYSLVNAKNHYLGLIQTESAYYQPAPAAPAPFTSLSAFHDPTSFSGGQGWGFITQNSQNILVFGAGLYSFFQNWSTTCTPDCQPEILSIDEASTVSIYSLSTVFVATELSVGGQAVISSGPNADGIASTVTAWT